MSSSVYYTKPTDVGAALLAATLDGESLELTTMALGDGGGEFVTPNSSQTALVNEVGERYAINSIYVHEDNDNWRVIEAIIPAEDGGYYIRELGAYDADGNLAFISNFPDTYKPVYTDGSTRDQTIRMIVMLGESESVELMIDPSVVNASKEYVTTQIAEHEAKDDPHPQYYTYVDESIEAIGDYTGSVHWFATQTTPSGFIKADGSELLIELYPELYSVIGVVFGGDGETTFNVPDLRGEFIRGYDDGRGVDTDREFGSWQEDAIRNITATATATGGAARGVFTGASGAMSVDSSKSGYLTGDDGYTKYQNLNFDASLIVPTADENRPRNIALAAYIKY